MEPEHDPLLPFHHLLVVGVREHDQHGTGKPGGCLNDVGYVALVAHLVEVGEVLAGELGVALQIVVGAVVDSFQLLPAEGELVLDVEGKLRVVG